MILFFFYPDDCGHIVQCDRVRLGCFVLVRVFGGDKWFGELKMMIFQMKLQLYLN